MHKINVKSFPLYVGLLQGWNYNDVQTIRPNRAVTHETERERELYLFCEAGTPEGQPLIYAGAYATVHNNVHQGLGKV